MGHRVVTRIGGVFPDARDGRDGFLRDEQRTWRDLHPDPVQLEEAVEGRLIFQGQVAVTGRVSFGQEAPVFPAQLAIGISRDPVQRGIDS